MSFLRQSRWLLAIIVILGLFVGPLHPRPTALAETALTHQVTWDSHSLRIDGKRVLIYSGEFHYWRLPSPELWTDRLEKLKAAGLNTVSIYFDWAYHSPAPGVYDFSGIRDIDRLLGIADHLGLYVLARVGPYMNGEADAGGLPGWLLTKQLFPRSQTWVGGVTAAQYSPLYLQYAREWYDHLLPIVARHQATLGKSVLMLQVENEYSQDTGSQQYMQELFSTARSDGITVPIFHNDYYFKGDWTKLVDIYGFDSYPYGFSCCHEWYDIHFHGIDTWETTLRQQLHVSTPMFVSELQGGSFDPWGGQGYDQVARTLDGDWLTAIDQSALAQGTTMLNTYMFVGGTTWGYQGEPQVYTSYDYGAPIAESGTLRPAYYAAHRLGMFLQTYGESLAGADATPDIASTSNPAVVVHARTDPTSGQQFIFLRHGDPGAPALTSVRLAQGGQLLTLPQEAGTAITVPGHGAALLTANVQTGPLHLNYSTSQVLTETPSAQGDYLVLYGPSGSAGETDFRAPDALTNITHNVDVHVTRTGTELRLNYHHTAEPRVVTMQAGVGTLHVIITSTDAASTYWKAGGLVISGPDLVTDSGGGIRIFTGGSRETVAYGDPADRSLLIDGRTTALPDPATGTTMIGILRAPASLSLPTLTSWKFGAEAPETQLGFDDSGWQFANRQSTNPNLTQPSTLPADDYGFHYGFVWYRGHFQGAGGEDYLTLTARHSYSVYLNGVYLGSGDAPRSDPPHLYGVPRSFAIPAGLVRHQQDNVIAILTESLGHDEGWIAGPAAQSPQGLMTVGFGSTSEPIVWRIQGAAQGDGVPVDTARGQFNASGLFGERNGWYLPGFNDGSWQSRALPDDWSKRGYSGAIGWYRTHFRLDISAGGTEPIGLTIPHASDKAVIWLNGWLVGRYWEQKGPQHTFYLPQGILNANGDNTLAIAVWNRGHAGGLTAVPILTTYGAMQEHALSLADPVPSTAEGYWHTQGNRIVDASGHPIRIAAVNWFGLENRFFVPAGLDQQPLSVIVARVKELGFNAIRLPFSNQAVEQNPIVSEHLDANPDLKGLHALEVMDRIVTAARQVGLKIILDDQRSSAGTQPQLNGLWYTKLYPETAWIHDWQTLVARYRSDPTVIGVDLRNEPHTGPPGPWSVQAYLHQGSTWGPYQGREYPKSDWHLAAQRGGDAVLGINPRLLIFVEGLQLYPDVSQPEGIDSYWWGGILTPARRYPVQLAVPHQLVYSPHEYGPLKWQMPFFGPGMTYASLKAVWEEHWAFLEKQSFSSQAPIFIGEFGTCGNSKKDCIEDRSPGSQGLWFSYLLTYLRHHPEIGWSFWALNGTSHNGDVTMQYILRKDWKTLRLPALVNALRDIELAPPP